MAVTVLVSDRSASLAVSFCKYEVGMSDKSVANVFGQLDDRPRD